MTDPAQPLSAEEIAKDFADEAVQWLCELPDRTSPDDWPEACLVTGEELHDYLVENISATLRAQDAEIAVLVVALKQFADPKNWSDEVGCLSWQAKRHAIDFAEHVLGSLPAARAHMDEVERLKAERDNLLNRLDNLQHIYEAQREAAKNLLIRATAAEQELAALKTHQPAPRET